MGTVEPKKYRVRDDAPVGSREKMDTNGRQRDQDEKVEQAVHSCYEKGSPQVDLRERLDVASDNGMDHGHGKLHTCRLVMDSDQLNLRKPALLRVVAKRSRSAAEQQFQTKRSRWRRAVGKRMRDCAQPRKSSTLLGPVKGRNVAMAARVTSRNQLQPVKLMNGL